MSVTDERRAPGETAAERCKNEKFARLDASVANALIERERNRSRRRIRMLFDGDDDLDKRKLK